MSSQPSFSPTPIQEQLLRACFGEETEASQARAACSALPASVDLDSDSYRLLPLLYRRWSGPAIAGDFLEHCRRAYLTAWGQNQHRLACIATLVTEFDKAGIETMLLKGAALTLNHYRDSALRNMDDFDLLVHRCDIEAAARLLHQSGWSNQGNCQPREVARRMRAHHSWHFYRGPDENCDLHCRPVPCCYGPRLAQMFWDAAQPVPLHGCLVKVPCPTDQLFHVCIHGLRWHNPPNVYWIADALTVLRQPESIDWDRLHRLASEGAMQDGLYEGLEYLRSAWAAPIPRLYLDRWSTTPVNRPDPAPRGLYEKTAFHISRFRRLRPFDPAWSRLPAPIAFPQYLAASLTYTFPSLLWKALQLCVGQVVNLFRMCGGRTGGRDESQRFVGQDGILRRIGNPPA